MEYDISNIPIDKISFSDRMKRITYISDKFSKYLSESILDVGCDVRSLRKYLNDEIRYVGIDAGGNPDIKINLETIDRLPFNDGEFHTVVCADVLEHLDNLHFIFSELVRITSRYMVISLPNNWVNLRQPIERGKGSAVYYGLPVEPPADRHKWFFSLTEAYNFFSGRASVDNLSIAEMRITEKPRTPLQRISLQAVSGSRERYLNRYAHTLWVVFEKNA
ncbi:MAG: class I SAM-dependent methyltransferase [Armatimonadota bacterium]